MSRGRSWGLPPHLDGGGRPWVLNADGTTAASMAEEEGEGGNAMGEGDEEEMEEEMASPDTLLARILHPTAPGPPAPFAGFDVRAR